MNREKIKKVMIVIIVIMIVIIITIGRYLYAMYKVNKYSVEKFNEYYGEYQNKVTDNNVAKYNKEIYSDIINNYKNLLSEKDEEKAEKDYDIDNAIVILADHENVYYTFEDIDSNGQDELIIIGDNDEILAVYTYNEFNEETVKLTYEASLGYRSHATIYNNGVIVIEGSSGAFEGIVNIVKLQSDGYTYKTSNYYYKYDESENLEIYTDYEYKDKVEFTSIEKLIDENTYGASKIDIFNLEKNEIK